MLMVFKKALFWIPFIQLFLLMTMPFFQHPLADDFAGFILPAKLALAEPSVPTLKTVQEGILWCRFLYSSAHPGSCLTITSLFRCFFL